MNDSNLNFEFRSATASEAGELCALASRSKAHWPYDKEYLQVVNSVVHVSPADVERWPFVVATQNGRICGFSAVCQVEGLDVLDHLWIDPPFIGRGLGKHLFLESVARAKSLGWHKFGIASDPYAEGFYLKMGARRVGQRQSKIKAGFYLPLMVYDFN